MSTATSQVVSQLQRSIARAIYGKEEAIQLALITLLARGHLLIEDVPGVGKTTLAQALAKSFHCSFQRIQFTSDLRSEEHTSELQSLAYLVCRLLLEKKKRMALSRVVARLHSAPRPGDAKLT